MITKAEIGKAFRELEKIGYEVTNFGSHRKKTSTETGVPDIWIVGHGFEHWVEIKTKHTKDALKPRQKRLGEKLKEVAKENRKVTYSIVNEYNYLKIRDSIILMESGVK